MQKEREKHTLGEHSNGEKRHKAISAVTSGEQRTDRVANRTARDAQNDENS